MSKIKEMSPSKKMASNAYTILEILAVISIIGILTVVGVVSYRGVSKNNVKTSLENDIRNGISQLKLEKASTGRYLSSEDLKTSNGNTIIVQELVAGVPTGGHCVSVTDVKTGTTLYGTTKNNEIKTGNCPAPSNKP